jgi:uncharacterized protein (DUF2062 family)
MGTLIASSSPRSSPPSATGRRARFVRERLRYVDAAHGSTAPWIAGGVAALVAAVLAAVLPFVGLAAALAFGVSVALGVAAGARDLKTGRYLVSDGH